MLHTTFRDPTTDTHPSCSSSHAPCSLPTPPPPLCADTAFWDPTTDPFLPACYSAEQQAGKALCKRFLQQVGGRVGLGWAGLGSRAGSSSGTAHARPHPPSSHRSQGLGLTVDPDKPLVAVISRLVPQASWVCRRCLALA